MSVVISLVGLAMTVIGIAAIYSGSLVIGIERGWTMVIAGSAFAAAGPILIAAASILRRLRRVEEALRMRAREDGPRPEPARVEPAPETPALPPLPASPPSPPPALRERPESESPAEATSDSDKVVGSYRAGGNAYVMFADGSIRAEMPTGEHRFRSMDEFKAYMLASAVGPAVKASQDRVPSEEARPQAEASPTDLSAKA